MALLAVWSSILYIQFGFIEYFALSPSLYFTFNNIRAYKMIAKSHLDFKSTEHMELTCSLFWRGDLNCYPVRSDSVGFDNDLQYW